MSGKLHAMPERGLAEALKCRQLLPAPPGRTTLERQYFHHFLTVACPFLPSGNEHVWMNDVPQLATYNADVMSSMLGLSAAHLACLHPSHHHRMWARIYRGRSLAALKGTLSNTTWTHAEVDSALALAFILAFQSQFMEDGLFGFMTMIRGSVLLSKYFVRNGHETSFNLASISTGPSVPESIVPGLPSLDVHCIRKGLTELNLLLPLVQTNEQTHFFLAIQRVFHACLDSTHRGFEEFWHALDNSIPPPSVSSDVFKALQAFLISLRLFMDPIAQYLFCPPEKPYNTRQEVRVVAISWAHRVIQDLPPRMRKFVGWPEAVVEVARKELRS